ncbi:sialin-like [Tropilaelaps mercedesae]|uniref:Sialin-like n=1 Tax=Tropilaelaps mercedesae TaxID=418985 RepID=A0A1V9X3A6_9ACAR|nr:sialin-like [Tropilaelaps mercedesae]
MVAAPKSKVADLAESIVKVGDEEKTTRIQFRYVLILLASLGLLCEYMMRVNLNVVIVMIVNQTAVQQTTKISNCFIPFANNTSALPASSELRRENGQETFAWDPVTQGLILSSFYWGYTFTPIVGGCFAERYSAKWLFGLSSLLNALLGFLIPVVTMKLGHIGLITLRVLQGLAEGVALPSIRVQLARWIPKNQRSTAVACTDIGNFLGAAIGLLSAGEIATNSSLGGWPSVFYMTSVVTVVWCIAWLALTTDTPQEHPCIGQWELNHILMDLGATIDADKELTTPWMDILCSVKVWVVHFAVFGNLYLQYTIITELPIYLATVLNFDIRSSGFFSALPYVGAIIGGIVAGPLADKMIRQEMLSRTAARKLFNTLALGSPSLILFVVVRVAGCNSHLSLILFIIAGTFRGMSEAGVGPMSLDMAPDFAGSMFGISVTIGAFSGMLVPEVTSFFIHKDNSTTNWSYSFYVAGIIGMSAALTFLLFASAEAQPWGTVKNELENNGLAGSSGNDAASAVQKDQLVSTPKDVKEPAGAK